MTIRLALVALMAMWAPAWCYCVMQAEAASVTGAGLSTTHDAAVPSENCAMADGAGAHSCCCSAGQGHGDSEKSEDSQDHASCLCGQTDSTYVDVRPAKTLLAELTPAFDLLVTQVPVPAAALSLPASGAYPFDTADGPRNPSLLEQHCLLTL